MLTISPFLLGQVSLAQSSRNSEAAASVTDWSAHHVIFSQPATAAQARRVLRDPRYRQQIARRSRATLPAVEIPGVLAPELQLVPDASFPGHSQNLDRDWSQDIGSGATVGAGNYPAKFSFDITSADCTNDFVVYNTSLEGSAGQATIVAYNNLYSGCVGLALGSAANFAVLGSSTVTNAGDSVVTGADIGISPGTSLTGFPPGILTPPAVQELGNPVASQAQADASTAYTYYQGLAGGALIGPVLDGLTFAPGVYKASSSLALSAGETVTLNGSGTYIFQIGSTLNIAGTVVLTGGATAGNVIWLVGSSATLEGTAVADGSIVALASITLDSGASLAGRAIALNGAVTMVDNAITTVDTVPSVYWAYNTAAKILTSPVFSLDGTQVAFVQSNSTGHGIVVLLKWAPSTTETVASPASLTRVSRASYPTCVAPCMTTATLGGTMLNNDTNSSIFYDYTHDTAYVGDDAGWLHKFTPFFNGVLAEIKTGGWPVELNPASPTALTSPVYDSGSGNVFVEDSGGYLYWVAPDGAVTQSGLLDHSTAEHGGPGLVEGPIIDSSAGLVYAFATSDGSGTGCPAGINNADCTVVYLTNTSFSSGDIPQKAIVGTSTMAGTTPAPLSIGAFDSTYENSTNATGNLYVCGNTGGDPVLYQVAITARNFGSVSSGPVLSTSFSPTPCSPVTDVFNPNASGGATEWIFASVQNGGASTPCASGGCVFNFQDTPWKKSTAYTVGQEVLDDHFQIQVVSVAGTSGTTTPAWSTTVDGLTNDGTLIWVDQGVQSAFSPGTWAAGFDFTVGTLILDSNGNIERCIASFGPSGGSVPVWFTTPGFVTPDFDVFWENLGAPATAALAEAGGTSGIIIDNIVGSGTELGASDIYFSTLNGGCGTSSTDGCAVQASQAALQ
jgi:hypothetical protein